MDEKQIQAAATTLWNTWQAGQTVDRLADDERPSSRAQGYAIQAAIEAIAGQSLFGWKIAATSVAGQKHIGVDAPLAGRYLSGRVKDSGAAIPCTNNRMKVAEAEFAFRFSRDLPPRAGDYTREEVMASVGAMYPAIEIPDSRFQDFPTVGAPQLIAECACAGYFVLGRAVGADFRRLDLANYEVRALRNGEVAAVGKGGNVMGDPWIALTWIANELAAHCGGAKAGQVVITGTCVVPWKIDVGDRIAADFGALGRVECSLTA